MPLALGAAAFLPLFLYDYVKMKAPGRRPGWLFALGCLMLCGSAFSRLWALDTLSAWRASPLLKSLWGALFALALAALVYTLFFALPAKTYTGAGEEGRLEHTGLYGLCRHPGFWPFALCWLLLWLFYGDGQLLATGLLQVLLNLAYVTWQDRWVFPRTLPGYVEYRRQVPFLIPKKPVRRTAQGCVSDEI